MVDYCDAAKVFVLT